MEAAKQETQEERIEYQMFADEAYIHTLPEGRDNDLILAFTEGLKILIEHVLWERKALSVGKSSNAPRAARASSSKPIDRGSSLSSLR